MALSPDLIQQQVGKETTWGTSVTPTAKLMLVDSLDLEPVVEADIHDEARGTLIPGYLADLKKIGAKGKVTGKQSFEDLHFLEGLLGVASPTGVGPYVRAYTAPDTSAPTPRIQTIVKGNGSNYYTGEGMLPTDAEFTFDTNNPLRYSYSLIGEEITTAQALAALSDRTVAAAMAQHVSLFIDSAGGTIGSTAISTAFFKGALKINGKRTTYPGMGSTKDAGFVDGKFNGTLELEMLFDATTKGYLDAILGGTLFQKLVRIKFQKDTNHILTFDFSGVALQSPKPFEVANDVTMLKFTLNAIYDSGAFANWFKVSSTNQVSALP